MVDMYVCFMKVIWSAVLAGYEREDGWRVKQVFNSIWLRIAELARSRDLCMNNRESEEVIWPNLIKKVCPKPRTSRTTCKSDPGPENIFDNEIYPRYVLFGLILRAFKVQVFIGVSVALLENLSMRNVPWMLRNSPHTLMAHWETKWAIKTFYERLLSKNYLCSASFNQVWKEYQTNCKNDGSNPVQRKMIF